MAGIAGIVGPEGRSKASRMLERISHRGREHRKAVQAGGVTMLAVWNDTEARPTPVALRKQAVWDAVSAPLPDPELLADHRGPFAMAAITSDGLLLARDRLGVKPLYYGHTKSGLAFASEVKGLLAVTKDVHEVPPGFMFTPGTGLKPFGDVRSRVLPLRDTEEIAAELRLRLEQAVIRRIVADDMGAWLSGGLDSSAIAALAKPHVRTLHSFVSGVEGAPDLKYAQEMAGYLGTRHHELVVTLGDLLAALPEVIYHLESFDALLVRSSVTNYLTARMASEYVGAVFSGEGADELFAGYAYLKNLPPERVPAELQDIIGRLHNTALQRVDRCAQAHGLLALVPFTDPDVLEYVACIPAEYKLYRQASASIEKWILRKAVEELLPASVLWRPKAKFWRGAGIGELLARHAEESISDGQFLHERQLPNGWHLRTKEELMYYRIFRDHFGELDNLEWMGRTKDAPASR
ncbi:MAG: asparagine synthase [Anaerolineae bacterium]|nr:asparagine synthase [Anaerolineae bacterium]